MKAQATMKGLFSVNELADASFKDFSVRKSYKNAKRTFWLMFNPYDKITECGKTTRDLKIGDEISDTDGAVLKIKEFGGGGYFGEDSFSWEWVKFYCKNGELS